jgi:hypothetical protein
MKSSIGVISEGVPPPMTPKEYPARGEDDVQIVLSSFRRYLSFRNVVVVLKVVV